VQEIAKAYDKVSTIFKNNLANIQSMSPDDKEAGKITAATQDILILLLPHLSSSDFADLFNLCLTNVVLCGKDNAVQKRGYKILTKIIESRKLTIDAEVTLRKLDEFVTNLMPAAKKASTFGFFLNLVHGPDDAAGSIYSFGSPRTLNPLFSYAHYSLINS
jgi:ribosomal RNA-processing protein 12